MNAKAITWTIVTILAAFGAVIMPYAILTAPAYIAIPVAVYLGVVLFIAAVGIGWHIVRAENTNRPAQFSLAAYLGDNPPRPVPHI